jgi:hypothetical protein
MTSAMERDTSRGLNGGTRQGERLQDAATGLVDQAARTAEAQASTTMTRAGETIEQIARAIRDAGSGLRDEQPQIAGIADTAAERIESAATYLRDHDAGETLEEVQQMARRQPALVIAGGLALGLLVGRVLRSGTSSMSGDGRGYGGDRSRYGGGSAAGYGSASAYGSAAGYDAGAVTGGYGAGAAYGATAEPVVTTGTTEYSGTPGTTGYGAADTEADLGPSTASTAFDAADTVATDELLGDDHAPDVRRGG